MTKAEFLAQAEARYDALQKLNSENLSFYAYEERLCTRQFRNQAAK